MSGARGTVFSNTPARCSVCGLTFTTGMTIRRLKWRRNQELIAYFHSAINNAACSTEADTRHARGLTNLDTLTAP